MKTFKMLSVEVLHKGDMIDFPLLDGIIINQENSHFMWILEMFIDKEYQQFFVDRMNEGKLLQTKVVISYPENEPAAFQVEVHAVKEIGDNISVLMKGRLKRARSKYAEQLLEELINEGIEGEQLLARFEADMKSRPRLKRDLEEDHSSD